MPNITRTRYDVLSFSRVERGSWRFIDSQTQEAIGPSYATRAELLADVESFARDRGFVAATPLHQFKLLGWFQDDRVMCANFSYKERKLSLWWTDMKTIGAMQFPDSPSAAEYLSSLAKHLEATTDQQITEEGDEHRQTDHGSLDTYNRSAEE